MRTTTPLIVLISTLLLWAIVEGAKPPIEDSDSLEDLDPVTTTAAPKKKVVVTKAPVVTTVPTTTVEPKKKVVVTKAPALTTVPTTTAEPKKKVVVTKAPAVTPPTTAADPKKKVVVTKAPVVVDTTEAPIRKKYSIECEQPDCVSPPNPGRCRAMIPAYFWNGTISTCDKFDWGGCAKGSTCNRFETLLSCNAACNTAEK